MGVCDEDPYVEGANCTDNSDCIKWLHSNLGNGLKTGRCIPSKIIKNQHVCEIFAWCPTEREKFPLDDSSLLKEAEDFTVLIRSEVYFHQFGEYYRRNNILKTEEENYLKNCYYDKKHNPYCPIFPIKTLVKEASEDGFENINKLGGVIIINVKWNCDLDRDFHEYCKPKYKFRRVDNDEFNRVKGYSFRKAYHHELNRRSLVKYHGIMFVIRNEAIGRKFSMIETVVNIAIGLALLRLSNIITNFTVWVMEKMKITVLREDKNAKDNESEETQEMVEKKKEPIP